MRILEALDISRFPLPARLSKDVIFINKIRNIIQVNSQSKIKIQNVIKIFNQVKP